MNKKTQKQDTDQRQGNNQGYQQPPNQQKDWNARNRQDSSNSGKDDRQDPEIDMPADTPEKTEKKIPNMKNDL
jgi:hypothetical protein